VKVLVVKLSSLGDVIHTLPALGDAVAALPGIRFDWVVEEAFAEIPAWHAAVDRVIPVALRRWRKRPLQALTGPECRSARAALGAQRYAAVIDAQGLIKSAVIARMAAAPRYGMDRASARERLAALAYNHALAVPRDRHAVERSRLLFARALGYALPATPADYGIGTAIAAATNLPPTLLFFHGSARAEKLWPEAHWGALAALATAAGYRVYLPWGDATEEQRARRIAAACDGAEVLPRLDLKALAALLRGARGAVAVDTGLGHLCAALGVPAVSLYGPTSTRLVGTCGRNQVQLQSPLAARTGADPAALMHAIAPTAAWQALQAAMARAG